MVQSFLNKLADLIIRRYIRLFILAVILTIGAGHLATKLEFRSSMQDLLPDSFNSVKVLREVTKKIGGIGYITLIIDTEDIDAGEKYTAAVAREIEKISEIRFVDYRLNIDFFTKNALLYLDAEDLKEILSRLEAKRDFEKKMLNPFFLNLEDEEVDLDFADIINKYKKKNINSNKNGYYVAKDNRKILLLAKPKGLASDLNYAKKVVADVKAAVAKVDPKKFHTSISVQYTDRYVIAPLVKEAILSDLSKTSIFSFLGVVCLITLYTRRKRAVLLIGVPLLMGVVWAFGYTYLVIGYVNLVTGFLSAILMGLGIDFGIHLFSRYLEDKRKGLSLEETIRNVVSLTGRASFTAAVTSSVAFLALIFTEFRGFSQFGVIAGFGLMSCYFSMLIVLPCMIMIWEKRYPIITKPQPLLAVKIKIPEEFLFPKRIVAVAIILFLIITASIGSLSFEYNFKNLQVRDLPELGLQDIANETMGISLTPNAILAKSYDEIREVTDILETRKKKLEASGKGSTIDKVASLITSIPDNQDEKLKTIAKMKKVADDKIFKYLRGKQAKIFNEAKDNLEPEKVTMDNLPVEVKRLFTGVDGQEGDTFLMWVFPGVLLWDGKEAMRFVNEIRHVNKVKSQPIDISGETFIMADMLALIKRDGTLAIILTLVTVFAILMFDLKNFQHALIVMSPLVGGVFLMFGVMIMFDIKINFLNVVMFPAIIGLGVDNGVHLFHRYKESGYKNVINVLKSTGSAVILSSLTTIIGFGSMMVARHKGLNSIGILAVVGIGSCLITSIVFFPAVLQIVESRSVKKSKKATSGIKKKKAERRVIDE